METKSTGTVPYMLETDHSRTNQKLGPLLTAAVWPTS